jgi:hypothetical protein
MSVRPWDQSERYAATARLNWSVTGRGAVVSTPDDITRPLLAFSPVAAARKWYWRLSDLERTACESVIVGPFPGPEIFPSYRGPVVQFLPRDGWREVEATIELERPR